jgi:hypothetical protein
VTDQEATIYAAYRVGQITTILHDDVQKVMPIPGIFRESMKGELAFRRQVLAEAGISADFFDRKD